MSEPFLAEVIIFAGNFAPRQWSFCDGQILAINTNQSLYSLLGTTYGGDGRTTFGLPDLRGRAPLGPRQGPGLSDYNLGQKGGAEQATLLPNQLPPHAHDVQGHNGPGDETNPVPGAFLASSSGDLYAETAGVVMGATTNAGANQGHENRQPYLAINFIIAIQGLFPPRN